MSAPCKNISDKISQRRVASRTNLKTETYFCTRKTSTRRHTRCVKHDEHRLLLFDEPVEVDFREMADVLGALHVRPVRLGRYRGRRLRPQRVVRILHVIYKVCFLQWKEHTANIPKFCSSNFSRNVENVHVCLRPEIFQLPGSLMFVPL